MAIIPPFDLEQILVVNVAGSAEIFTFLAVILLSYAMARYDFPDKITLVMFGLFAIIMALYLPSLYIIVILIGGITTFYHVARLMKS